MKKRKIIQLALPVVALILELLPWGAVLNFAGPDYSQRSTYSYFDLTPFGFANFGPLLTAIGTCVLLLLAGIALLLKKKNALRTAIITLSAVTLGTSLLPLMFGLRYFTVIAAGISLCMVASLLIPVLWREKD